MLIGYYIIVGDINKRKLHHHLRRLHWVKPWYFLVLAIVSLTVCVFALRANNQHMRELRSAVYAADKAGTDVQTPLKELQAYVTSHMNTSLSSGANAVYPPIQLQYTYERLVKAQNDQFAKANSQLYNEAQKECERLNPTDFSGRNRVPCIEQYVLSHSTKKLPIVPDALYKFSFASPRWSPDLAGWTMLVAILSGMLFVTTLAGKLIARRL